MDWYYILLIILGIILIFYLGILWFSFRTVFKRGSNKPLTELDLTKTHYAPYIDILYKNMNEMFSRQYEEVYINNGKIRLYGRYFNNNSDTTIIMVHGYRAVPYSNFSYQANYFLNHGYNIFFPYQRAHDHSDGHFITFGYKEMSDINKWCEFIHDKYQVNIILYGTSMGAATVVNTAGNYHHDYLKGVIEDCGFLNAYDAIKIAFKNNGYHPNFVMQPLRLCTRLFGFSIIKNSPFDNVSKINVPIVFIHSKLDKEIPYNSAEILYEKANNPKLIILNDIGGHTTGFMTSKEEVREEILKFMKDNMK